MKRDPVDAASDAKTLAELLVGRAEAQLAQQQPVSECSSRKEYFDAVLLAVSETGSDFSVNGNIIHTGVRYSKHIGKVGKLTESSIRDGEHFFSVYGAQEYRRAPELDVGSEIGWKADGLPSFCTAKNGMPGGEFYALRDQY